MLQYILAGLALGSIYAIAASALVVTYISAGVLNFAFASIAYFIARCYYWFNTQQGWTSYNAALICLLVIAPLLGVFLYLALFRFVRDKSTLIKVVVTIGLSVALPAITDTDLRPRDDHQLARPGVAIRRTVPLSGNARDHRSAHHLWLCALHPHRGNLCPPFHGHRSARTRHGRFGGHDHHFGCQRQPYRHRRVGCRHGLDGIGGDFGRSHPGAEHRGDGGTHVRGLCRRGRCPLPFPSWGDRGSHSPWAWSPTSSRSTFRPTVRSPRSSFRAFHSSSSSYSCCSTWFAQDRSKRRRVAVVLWTRPSDRRTTTRR